MHPLLVRFAAPAAFLLAATIAILLVRSALRDDDQPAARPAPATTAATTTRATTTRPATTRTSTEGREFYEIQAGDTLGSVASRHGTTVEALAELNPGIDPVGLQVGQRIRVK